MTRVKWYVVPTDGDSYEHAFEDSGDNAKLHALQELCDGYIERIELGNAITVWFNEEGLLRQLPDNLVATELVELLVGRKLRRMLCGTAVFTGPDTSSYNPVQLLNETGRRTSDSEDR